MARVHIEESFDPGYSEYTPGIGDFVLVNCYDSADRLIRSDAEEDTVDLIRSVCQFAAGLTS